MPFDRTVHRNPESGLPVCIRQHASQPARSAAQPETQTPPTVFDLSGLKATPGRPRRASAERTQRGESGRKVFDRKGGEDGANATGPPTDLLVTASCICTRASCLDGGAPKKLLSYLLSSSVACCQ